MIGKNVFHRVFGKGIITSLTSTIVTADFSGVEKPFRFPGAFGQYLTTNDAELLTLIEQKREELRIEEATAAEEADSSTDKTEAGNEATEHEGSGKKLNTARVGAPSDERIIICNGAWMVNYNLYTNGDAPKDGGKYVEVTGNAHEKINFHVWDDGIVRGFVQAQGVHPNEGGQVRIERIDGSKNKRSEEVDDVTVVFCARNPFLGKNTVIGWYRNATVMRRGKTCPNAADDYLPYICYTAKENAHLLDVKDRTFIIPRARNGECGMGQSNLWFIDTEKAQEFRSKLINYIEQNS